MVSDTLHARGMRERVRLICSGKLITPSSVAWALGTGADFVVSARGFMFALGCIQAMKCNRNTCPTGITTNLPHLTDALDPSEKSVRVANYHHHVVHNVEVLSHSCGVTEPRQLRRKHMRIIQPSGKSVPMDVLWPRPERRETYREAS